MFFKNEGKITVNKDFSEVTLHINEHLGEFLSNTQTHRLIKIKYISIIPEGYIIPTPKSIEKSREIATI